MDHTGQLEFMFTTIGLDQTRSLLWCEKMTTARWLLCAAARGLLRGRDRRIHTRAIVGRTSRLAQMNIEFNKYLHLNQGSMPNYAKQSRNGLPVSSSRSESTANALVNQRTNKVAKWAGRQAVHSAFSRPGPLFSVDACVMAD